MPRSPARIALLTGGSTPERSVALSGAREVAAALRTCGHAVQVVDISTGFVEREAEPGLLSSAVGCAPPSSNELAELRRRENLPALLQDRRLRDADVLFLVLHGQQGEGGQLQALLELGGLPFVGSDSLGSTLAMDKDTAKRLMRYAGVATPDWEVWPSTPQAIARLGAPLVVKPSRVGSTIGLSLVATPTDRVSLLAAAGVAAAFDPIVLLEAYLPGRELTVGVLGDAALGVGEIVTATGLFDSESKYTPGGATEIFPADLPSELTESLREMAVRVHRALKLRDFSRVDFRLDAAGRPYCLEANTLPGMTPTSLLPQSASCVGIDFPELCDRIVGLALAR
ncbi:MAG TPA: D-alanine--D-alanine ligase [Thermoanaerobaculia bacterium]|nr:D-alanine--D-alanine ligase [Thermoanaerobaculia bacterium]